MLLEKQLNVDIVVINLMKFYGKSVNRMESLFQNCYKLISLDLSNLEANPSNMNSIFQNCYLILIQQMLLQ